MSDIASFPDAEYEADKNAQLYRALALQKKSVDKYYPENSDKDYREQQRLVRTRSFLLQILAENWEIPDSSKKKYEDLIADCDARLALFKLKN